MDDQHAHAGYDGYSTGSFQTDPLFGALPDAESHYGAGRSGQYDSTQWDTTGAQAPSYDAYGTQQYDATGTWATADYQTTADIPAQSTGQWDANAWNQTGQFGTGSYETGTYENGQYETGQYETTQFTQAADTTGHWNATPGYDTGAYATGAYDTTAWNTGHTDHTAPTTSHTGAYATIPPQQQVSYETAEFPAVDLVEAPVAYEATHDAAHDTQGTHDTPDAYEQPYGHAYEPEPEPYDTPEARPGDEPAGYESELASATPSATPVASVSVGPRSARRSAGRSRRRTPAKRSALFTVAVPSACVMGVAGIAAASVSGVGSGTPDEKKSTATTASAADPGSVKPVAVNNKLDTQLANLSADADDFADRASRTQERIDLRARQAAEKKRKAEEAARKEAARPKFALPVEQQGLSAYYGQAGVNWMSVHSGIDFPVSYGTPVMAATDGTVRTQYNTAYGNMAIVTAADGTETWYCHLSSTKVRSGSVQAGDVIAYSGNSGNSTGPHLHFEVRPGGSSAVDPLPWLRSHDLSPT